MDENNSDSNTGENDVDLARRKLLKAAAWVPPAVVASVSIGTNHAIAWSCGPGPCGPEYCGPNNLCMPDRPCMPDLPCMPDKPCMPDS